ncbi:MAG: LuxR C-terminal-related transcriptional regulator [Thermomicrobiales bacterium]|jgi:DNA-binding NarL/FixJ family response regulator
MADTVRVVVVEMEPISRRGLVGVLQEANGIEVVGSASTASDAFNLIDDASPDVALVGTTIADFPGLAMATEVRRRYPAVPTIIVTALESDDELFGAIRAGAAAYCGHDISEQTLIDLTQRAARGEYVINEQLLSKPYVAARVLDQFRVNASGDVELSNAFMPLTDRELEILRKVSEGLTNAEIGYALGISAQTVKNHVTSILRKLAVNDRTQAVVTALRRGWLTIDGTAPGSEGNGVTPTPTSYLGRNN